VEPWEHGVRWRGVNTLVVELDYGEKSTTHLHDMSCWRLMLWVHSKIKVLWMTNPAVVRIVGVPVACAQGVRESWRALALWFAGKPNQLFAQKPAMTPSPFR